MENPLESHTATGSIVTVTGASPVGVHSDEGPVQ